MKRRIWTSFARQAGTAMPRRGSLQLLATTLVAGVTAPRAATAGKSDKGKSRCKAQKKQCLTIIREHCAAQVKRADEVPDPVETCVASMRTFCDAFAKCQAGAGLTCLRQASAPVKDLQ
jgi:hypothetical protein